MASEVYNPSVEIASLPYPLTGALKGGQRIILSYSPSDLATASPSLASAFRVRDIGSWSGSVDDASYGLAAAQTTAQTVTINDATTNAVTVGMTLSHTTSGTAAANIGAGLLFKAENDAGTAKKAGAVEGALSTVTASSEVGEVNIRPAVADTLVTGLKVTGVASAVNGITALASATGVAVRMFPYGETNASLRLAGKGTGSVALTNPANDALRVEANATGLGFFAATPVAQQAAQTALTITVAGDMPGPTAGEITTRLNLIENRLNAVSAALRNLGLIAT
jgi:hypothetical protein